MSLNNPNISAELVGQDTDDCGIELYDERDNRHIVTVGWNGKIIRHSQESYPHKREERTEEEQLIMSQVEARARYAAQQEFPEEGILPPMWDPAFLDRGVEALVNYDHSEFESTFRDFYLALRDPTEFVAEPRDAVISKPFAIDANNRVADVSDLVIRYTGDNGGTEQHGSFPEYEQYDRVVCQLPQLEFNRDFSFEENFSQMVIGHLMAQIRDIYRHMGEEPPDEYKVDGMGKLDYHGGGLEDYQ